MSRTPWLQMDDDLSSVADGEGLTRTAQQDRSSHSNTKARTQDTVLGYYDDPLADTPRRPPVVNQPLTSSGQQLTTPGSEGILFRSDREPLAAGVRTPASRRARVPGGGDKIAVIPATPPPSKRESVEGPQDRKPSARVESTPVPSRAADAAPSLPTNRSASGPKDRVAATAATFAKDVAVSPHRPFVEGPTPAMVEEMQKRFQSELAHLQAALLEAKEGAAKWEAEALKWRSRADEEERAAAEVRSQLQRLVHQTQLDADEIARLRQWNSELARERQEWESERFRLRQELQAIREESLSRPPSAAGSEPALLLNADSLRTLRELLVGPGQSVEGRSVEQLGRSQALRSVTGGSIGDSREEIRYSRNEDGHRSPRSQASPTKAVAPRSHATSALVESISANTPPPSKRPNFDRSLEDRNLGGTPGPSGRLNNHAPSSQAQTPQMELAKGATASHSATAGLPSLAPPTVTPAPHIVQDPNAVRHQPKEEVEEVERLERKLMTACQERGEVEEAFRKVEFLKIRSLAEKARRETLQRRLAELNHDISDARRRLRELSALER